jgi:hypothetical protein
MKPTFEIKQFNPNTFSRMLMQPNVKIVEYGGFNSDDEAPKHRIATHKRRKKAKRKGKTTR